MEVMKRVVPAQRHVLSGHRNNRVLHWAVGWDMTSALLMKTLDEDFVENILLEDIQSVYYEDACDGGESVVGACAVVDPLLPMLFAGRRDVEDR